MTGGIDPIGKVKLFGAEQTDNFNKKKFHFGEFAGAVLPNLLNGKLNQATFTNTKASESGQSAFGG